MIHMPRRSVTRFFIPLIDVLILLFSIYLLMPIVQPGAGQEAAAAARNPVLAAEERRELTRLRTERRQWGDVGRLERERDALREQLGRLRQEKLEALEQRLAIRVLEIGEDGKLYYYNPDRPRDRRLEITADNVRELIRSQREDGKEPYFLILYPRPAAGSPVFPLREQREEYDRWFAGVAHGYDIPVQRR